MGVACQDCRCLWEIHVAQAGFGHLVGPPFCDVVAFHRGGFQQLAAGEHLVAVEQVDMFPHAFLEEVLAAQHVLQDGYLVPESTAGGHDLHDPGPVVRVADEVFTHDRASDRQMPDLIDTRAAGDLARRRVETVPFTFAQLRGGCQHSFHHDREGRHGADEVTFVAYGADHEL